MVTVAGLGVKPTYPLLVVFANESGALLPIESIFTFLPFKTECEPEISEMEHDLQRKNNIYIYIYRTSKMSQQDLYNAIVLL